MTGVLQVTKINLYIFERKKMSVKIRMMRLGRRHRPFFRINAMESRNPRNGRILEKLGHYDPLEKDVEKQVVLDLEKTKAWIEKGAEVSDSVTDILRKKGIITKASVAKKVRRDRAKALAKQKGVPFTKADKIAIEKAAEKAAEEEKATAEAAEAAAKEAAEKAEAKAKAKEEAAAEKAKAKEEAAAEKAAAKEAAKEAPAEEASAEETPAEESPAEDAPTEEATAKDVPAEEAATEEAPAGEASVEDAPAEEESTEEKPE